MKFKMKCISGHKWSMGEAEAAKVHLCAMCPKCGSPSTVESVSGRTTAFDNPANTPAKEKST